MKLPDSPRGFAVNVQTGTIHERHAKHARGLRRTTAAGVAALLGRKRSQLCKECFPPPEKPDAD
jgi:hypothetical protein